MMTCANETQLFQDCIKNTGGDVAPCQSYMDMMMKCKSRMSPLLNSSIAVLAVLVNRAIFPHVYSLSYQPPKQDVEWETRLCYDSS